ncbi:hypothetical protein BAUCODRAFT_549016 [Baudoinia panamericana UAMH 10762]|uniref:Uncharacterized protein n=1 Tax=Baudoinia panamericana (strain UAMH 10762) TaxID=717646 RepID=M2MSH8_BAUPA|nr:uncharacterized protein BAUCODRAFT_549016 [Baudoinia panamericana UAMH 10762]EMC94463.1 hypothetical protein BAUCODRAFT_549016 [Baudoinia panamericana UAMH 10762]
MAFQIYYIGGRNPGRGLSGCPYKHRLKVICAGASFVPTSEPMRSHLTAGLCSNGRLDMGRVSVRNGLLWQTRGLWARTNEKLYCSTRGSCCAKGF